MTVRKRTSKRQRLRLKLCQHNVERIVVKVYAARAPNCRQDGLLLQCWGPVNGQFLLGEFKEFNMLQACREC